MSLPVPLDALAPVARIVANALAGRVPDPGEAARALVGLGLALVPVEELRGYLDEAARARGEAVFESLKDAKFGRDRG